MTAPELRITGMTCDHCAGSVEEGLNVLAKVESIGGVDRGQLLKAVESRGYGASLLDDAGKVIGASVVALASSPPCKQKRSRHTVEHIYEMSYIVTHVYNLENPLYRCWRKPKACISSD